jgi:hypothetical protein
MIYHIYKLQNININGIKFKKLDKFSLFNKLLWKGNTKIELFQKKVPIPIQISEKKKPIKIEKIERHNIEKNIESKNSTLFLKKFLYIDLYILFFVFKKQCNNNLHE